ncbi:DUF4340 domain-containing protein [Treponema bryantii]|uniref:DUF4340 domain-containing protein n=1 Tax=Treponema bryantii TaxID=163 RepID=UPI002B289CB2|nr:hypothetical protein TRBR_16240 [Treponema bryantii]
MLNARNSSKINKNSKILIAVTAFLVILYSLSFVKSCSSQDKREKVKTALVNQKYKDSINSIILQDSTGSIEFTKQEDFWIITSFNNQISIPASSERINNLLNELTKVRNLYKISDKISKNSSLGLTNGTEFHLRYSYSNEGSYRELLFGNQDFSLSSRYMMSGENTKIYEIDSSLDVYLTTSVQSWSDPNIISSEILPTNDIQKAILFINDNSEGPKSNKISNLNKLLELRHGGLLSESEYQNLNNKEASANIEIEIGNKSSISLEIFPSENESVYFVKTRYFKPDSKSAFYNSYSKISSWTYNKIKETTL